MTLETLDLWSEEEQSIVPFDVSKEEETDEGGNVAQVVMVKHGEEIHRFSPNTTDAELTKFAEETNGSHE